MRIAILCKRHPQQRDLLERPYGRFHHLPAGLAAAGHEVLAILVSHRGLPAESREMAGVRWIALDLRTLGPFEVDARIGRELSTFSPDWVMGFSDAQFGWLADRHASRVSARLAVDAYDNYEAYMPWNKPLHVLWRRAVRRAALVTAAGPQLAARLQSHRRGGRAVEVLPMAADPNFKPMDAVACRRRLRLPEDVPLVGYLGSWGPERGTEGLLTAFRKVYQQRPDARLVLSGAPPAHVLAEPGVTQLGWLADELLPVAVNSLDVACVVSAETGFGRYSYPAKLCEAMACGVAVVASNTEAIRWMLQEDASVLANPGDSEALAAAILRNLNAGRRDYRVQHDWTQLSGRLSRLLAEQAVSQP